MKNDSAQTPKPSRTLQKIEFPFFSWKRMEKLTYFPPQPCLMFFLGKKTTSLPSEIPAMTIYNSLGTVLPNNPNPTAVSVFLFQPVSIVHGDEGCPAGHLLPVGCPRWPAALGRFASASAHVQEEPWSFWGGSSGM